MASTIKPKRSAVAGNVPTTAQIGQYEIAMNTADKKIYTSDGTSILQIGAGALSGLSDVSFSSAVAGQLLTYSASTSKWLNTSITSSDSSVTITQSDSGIDLSSTYTKVVRQDVRNQTGATLVAGTVVYLSGSSGNKALAYPAQANAESTSSGTFGIINADIPNNQNGSATIIGLVTGLNTSAYTEGQILWLSPTTAGGFTTTKPSAPNHAVFLGLVTRSHTNQGSIQVRVQNGYELEELHNVAISSVANKDFLYYDSTTSLWKNAPLNNIINGGTYTINISGSASSVPWSGVTGAPTNVSSFNNDASYVTPSVLSSNLANYLVMSGGTYKMVAGTYGPQIYPTASGGSSGGGWARAINFADGSVATNFASFGALGGINSINYAYLAIGTDPTNYVSSPYLRLSSSNYTEASGSIRSPIYYDLDNTGYYVDPSSTSSIYNLTVNNLLSAPKLILNTNNDLSWGGSYSSGNSTISATGSALYFYPAGNISGATLLVTNSATNSTRALQENGYQVLHANNYSSYAQPVLVSGTNIKTINGTSILGSGNITVTASTANTLDLGGHYINNSAWAGSNGYHGYTFNGGNYRFGFSATSGVVDVYADGNFYATDNSYLVLHAGNYNSYSPSLTGSGASGTWGISISGNAATVSSITSSQVTTALGYTPLSNAISYLPLTGGTLSGVLSSNKPINLANATYSTQAVLVGNWSGAGWWGLGSESGHIIKLDQVAATDTATPTWVGATDITLKLGTKTVLDSGNYTSTLDGRYLRENTWINGKYFETSGAIYSTILYDANNSGYYCDPSATSYLNTINTSGPISQQGNQVLHGGNWSSYIYPTYSGWDSYPGKDANSVTGGSFAKSYFTYSNNAPATGAFIHFPAGGYDLQLNGSYGNSEGFYFRTRNGDIGSFNGWRRVFVQDSWQDNKYFGSDGTIYAGASSRSPIFYDYNDTGYYIDPDSTSATALRMRGGALFGPNPNWSEYLYVGGNGDYDGTHSQIFTTGNLHLEPKAGCQIYLSHYRGGWFRAYGMYDNDDTGYYVDPNNTSRMYRIDFNNLYYASDTNYGFLGANGYFDTVNSGYASDPLELIYVKGNEVRIGPNGGDKPVKAATYYDYADTSYYVDANGTSSLNTVQGYRFATQSGSQSPDNSHPGYGMRPFYSWNIGQAYNSTGGYSNGITIGSHPGDQAYGFQIVQNMWDDVTYTRRYNGGWQSWKKLAWMNDWFGSSLIHEDGRHYATIHYDSNDSGYYCDPNGTSYMSSVHATDWFRSRNNTGVYWQDYARGIWVADAEVTYGNITTYGAGRNGWRGYGIYPNNAILMANGGTVGIHNPQFGWIFQSDMNGNVTWSGSVTAQSDLRVKDNVREIDNVTERRNTLAKAAIKYERNGRTRIGYGAQILKDNGCSEFVMEADDALKIATGLGTLSVDYAETTSILAVASKMTDDRVEELELKVKRLESLIAQLIGE